MTVPSPSLRAILAGGVLAASAGSGAAQNGSDLYDTCFARDYGPVHLAAHPGQRVSSISVQFLSFEDDLLATVIYTLKFGTRFGFSGACYVRIEGGWQCQGCANDSCEANGEEFKIYWPGGDTVTLVNDTTGMLAGNAEGGRDYLASDGEHRAFLMRRAAAQDCAW
jgi:hypothetical protein